MRCYVLERMVDVSGVSGTGIVAEAVESANGKVALFWTGAQSPAKSVAIYDNMADATAVHCHNGASRFVPLLSLTDDVDPKAYSLAKSLKELATETREGPEIIDALKQRQEMLEALPFDINGHTLPWLTDQIFAPTTELKELQRHLWQYAAIVRGKP